jgi:ribosomal protein S14
MDNIPDVKEALNEYFKLKLKYETQIKENKKKIINNQALSNREKRSEYLKLKPKCINCKRPSGTIFKTTFFELSK